VQEAKLITWTPWRYTVTRTLTRFFGYLGFFVLLSRGQVIEPPGPSLDDVSAAIARASAHSSDMKTQQDLDRVLNIIEEYKRGHPEPSLLTVTWLSAINDPRTQRRDNRAPGLPGTKKELRLADFTPEANVRAQHVPFRQPLAVAATMFGVFMVYAPANLKSSQPSQIEITFQPIVFVNGLRPKLGISFNGYSVDASRMLQIKPAHVVAESSAEFQQGIPVSVTGDRLITWYWSIEAPRSFGGADFDILMSLELNSKSAANLTLPVRIAQTQERPFVERFQTLLFGSLANSILTTLGGTILAFIVGRRTASKKLSDPQPISSEEAPLIDHYVHLSKIPIMSDKELGSSPFQKR
jgi:hypothetical protein